MPILSLTACDECERRKDTHVREFISNIFVYFISRSLVRLLFFVDEIHEDISINNVKYNKNIEIKISVSNRRKSN